MSRALLALSALVVLAITALTGCSPHEARARSGASTPGPGLYIRPYLSWLDAHSATLNWRLTQPGASRFEYGRTFGLEAGVIETRSALQQRVVLAGLEPDTIYHYRVDDAFEGSFRTDALDGTVRFSVIGHTHGSEHLGHYPDRLSAARMRDLGVHFGLHAGDATYFNSASGFREHFFEVFADFLATTPIYIAPGNHDTGWPFIYGLSLASFKELFTYPYPESILTNDAEAFYAVRKGGLNILVLSYTSSLAEGSAQREWIARTLEGSTADFNLLVYGGANQYFDEPELLSFLSGFRVDGIFNGDGDTPDEPWRRVHGIPIYFVGTGNEDPHPLLYCEYRPEVLTIKQLDAAGNAGDVDWIHTQRRRPQRIELELPENPDVADGVMNFRFRFKEPVPSETVNGMQLAFAVKGARNKTLHVYVTPDDRRGRGEPGYRTQYTRLGIDDELVTLPFIQRLPSTGEPFRIRTIYVTVQGVDAADEVVFREAYLY